MITLPFSEISKRNIAFFDVESRNIVAPAQRGPISNFPYRIGYDNLGNKENLNHLTDIAKGHASIIYKDDSFSLCSDMLYQIPASVDTIKYSESGDYEYYRINYSAFDANYQSYISISDNISILFEKTPSNIVSDIYNLTDAYIFQDNMYSLKSSYLFSGLMYNLLTMMKIENKHNENETSFSSVSNAINYLNEYYVLNPTDAQLAQICHLSEPYFRKCFKNMKKMTPVEYKNHLKIHRACEILKGSDNSIDTIAKELGFSSSHYFCRTFKSIIGVSPTYYRKYV